MWYKQEDGRVIVTVYVQPGAKRTEIVGFHGDALKIRLSAAPMDGRANDALLQYVARLFDVSLRQVAILRGDKSRYKKVAIIGSNIEPLFIVKNSR